MQSRARAWRTCLAAIVGAVILVRAAPAGGDSGNEAQIVSAAPVPQVAGGWTEPTALSPSGRWALFHSYGPGSAQDNIHIADLTGRRRPATLGYARAPVFVSNGNSLAYWRYDLAGGSGLYLRNLETGQERRAYPSTQKQELGGSALHGRDARWNPPTGEILFIASQRSEREDEFGIRLKDGRLRRIGPARAKGIGGPDGLSAFTIVRERKQDSATISSVWVAFPGLKNRRRVSAGSAVGWLGAGGRLLVSRRGGTENGPTSALFRVDVDTSIQRFLYEHAVGDMVSLSPSKRWLGAVHAQKLSLISTADGRRVAVPVGKVSSFFWGRTDGTLFFLGPSGWRRAQVHPGGGAPAAPPKPDLVSIPLSPKQMVQWHPLESYSGPWEVYLGSPIVVTGRKVGDQTWLGTTQGLRILDAQGREMSLAPWQSALRGRRIDQIVLDGEQVWLATRRGSPFNAGEYESQVVRVDRRSGNAEVRHLETTGFGRGDYVQDLLPGQPFLALGGPYGHLEVWEADGVRYSASSETSGRRFTTSCAAHDGRGVVWMGNAYGLYRWRYEQGKAEHWTEKHGLPSVTVLSVARADGRIWIGTAGGLATLHPQTGKITSPPAGDVLGDEPVMQLIVTPGVLYAVTPGMLAGFDLNARRWTRWPLPPGAPAVVNWDGKRLVGSFGAGAALMAFNGRGSWWEVARLPAGDLPSNPISVLLWHAGNLWCGHERALSRLDPRTGNWKTYPLPAATGPVQHLAAEDETVWAGLAKGGLLELNARTGATRRWLGPRGHERHDENAGSSLAVEGVVADRGYLYVLTHLGLYRLDRQTGAQRYMNLRDFREHLHGGGGKVLQSNGKSLWLLARQESSPAARLVRFSLPDLKPEVLPNPRGLDHFGHLAVEPGRGIWFLQDGPKQGTLDGRVLAHYQLPRRFRNQPVQALAWSPGFVWFAVAGQPPETPYVPIISRVSLADGQWQVVPPCPLSGIRQLLVAGDSLWAATANGLARISLNDLRPKPLDHRDRAPLPPEEEIFLALVHKDFAEVKALLDSGVPVDVHPFRGQTPLMTAAGMNWLEMVRFLLDRGAKVNAANEDGATPLARAGNVEIARLLLDRGADPNALSRKDGYPLLIERLVRDRDENIAKLLIEKGADVNIKEPYYGITPLNAAVRYGPPGFVRLLLERGAKVQVQDNEGNTPLMHAFGSRREEDVRLLLEHGADINKANKYGDTALHWMVRSSDDQALKTLLGRGANLEPVGSGGWTPLLAAAAAANFEAVGILVGAGANVNARSKTGQTTLMFAARRGRTDAVKLLLAKGAKVNVKDQHGKTASKIARESGSDEIAQLLAAAGEKR